MFKCIYVILWRPKHFGSSKCDSRTIYVFDPSANVMRHVSQSHFNPARNTTWALAQHAVLALSATSRNFSTTAGSRNGPHVPLWCLMYLQTLRRTRKINRANEWATINKTKQNKTKTTTSRFIKWTECRVRSTAAGCSLGLGARWLMAPLKHCSCQSSTFIRPRHLVIVIPQQGGWQVGRWVQAGGDVIWRSLLTGPHFRCEGGVGERGVKHLPRWGHLTCKGAGDLWFVTHRWAGQVESVGLGGGVDCCTAAADSLITSTVTAVLLLRHGYIMGCSK